MSKRSAYLDECFERGIVRHLVINAVGSDGVVGNVLHVGLAEVECCIKHGSSNALDPRMLFQLNFMQLVNKASMMRVQLLEIMEHILQELVQPFNWDDGGLCVPQGTDVHLLRIVNS